MPYLNEPSVSPSRPLGIQAPALRIRHQIDRLVQDLEVVRLSPFFRVVELLVCIWDDPFSRTEEAPRDQQ